jgi:hypothetical protein
MGTFQSDSRADTQSVGCATQCCPGGVVNAGGSSQYFTVCNYFPRGMSGRDHIIKLLTLIFRQLQRPREQGPSAYRQSDCCHCQLRKGGLETPGLSWTYFANLQVLFKSSALQVASFGHITYCFVFF